MIKLTWIGQLKDSKRQLKIIKKTHYTLTLYHWKIMGKTSIIYKDLWLWNQSSKHLHVQSQHLWSIYKVHNKHTWAMSKKIRKHERTVLTSIYHIYSPKNHVHPFLNSVVSKWVKVNNQQTQEATAMQERRNYSQCEIDMA